MKNLCMCDKTSLVHQARLYHAFLWKLYRNQTYVERFEAFSNRTILKIISKIGTYSYCTPLLICVGDCATVLVVWLPIILFECVAQFGRARDL